MRQRSFLICLVTAVVLLAGIGAPVLSAAADPRAITATLATGQVVPLTVDAAPGTPLANVALPADLLPMIVSISDGTTTVQAGDLLANKQSASATGPQSKDSSGLKNRQSLNPGSSQGTGTGISKPDSQVDPSNSSGEGFTNPDATLEKDDAPGPDDPDYSLALPGPAPMGVPNFFIDRFRIPPFLLPIYQAAGTEYGVRWEILAAINEIETDYGRNLNVSSAGALGWMQFMPATWKTYGTDANDDGSKDPYNPVDAIFAAARYLRAAGADKDIRRAIFAYNHADWYVDSVMLRAKLISGLPSDLVGSLTGLTQGRFPVAATARYAGAIDVSDAGKTVAPGENAALPVDGSSSRTAIRIFAAPGSKVIAVHDGKITAIGISDQLGRYIRLRDVFGNTYTYAHLGEIAQTHEVRVPEEISDDDLEQELSPPPRDPEPTTSATAGKQGEESGIAFETKTNGIATPTGVFDTRRLFATGLRAETDPKASPDGLTAQPLVVGSEVTAGSELGRIGDSLVGDPHVEFSIRPAGRGAPKIDPKPILDGWKLLETTAIYRAADKNPFFGPDAQQPTAGQILLMSKDSLIQRVLADPRIEVYECGRRDIRAGIIDRRVLATLEFLATSGLEPTVTSLRCGHSHLTKSGRVSYHSSGNGVDIAAINGTPILGHQGADSITDTTVRKLLTLQGAMKPAEIITLMTYEDTDNTFALSDHADHIHVGFRPADDPKFGKQFNALLKPSQWNRLMDRLNQIENPIVPTAPSKYSIDSDTSAHSHD